MFINITTNGASNILISVPSERADKSLGAIINLFEQNAVFIRDNYSSIDVVTPESTVTLGDTYNAKNYNGELEYKVEPKNSIIEEFEPANNDFFVSFNEFKKKHDQIINEQRMEISKLKETIDRQVKKIEALTNCVED